MWLRTFDKKFAPEKLVLYLFRMGARAQQLARKKARLAAKPGLKFDVSDITESPAYIQLPLGQDDVTLTWNTDGVPIFHSS